MFFVFCRRRLGWSRLSCCTLLVVLSSQASAVLGGLSATLLAAAAVFAVARVMEPATELANVRKSDNAQLYRLDFCLVMPCLVLWCVVLCCLCLVFSPKFFVALAWFRYLGRVCTVCTAVCTCMVVPAVLVFISSVFVVMVGGSHPSLSVS